MAKRFQVWYQPSMDRLHVAKTDSENCLCGLWKANGILQGEVGVFGLPTGTYCTACHTTYSRIFLEEQKVTKDG